MREVFFIKSNKEKWQRFESLLKSKSHVNPDDLAELYTEAIDDLSFAKTYFPQSKSEIYLNNLTANIHQEIFRNKKESVSRYITFWTREIPEIFSGIRRELLVALVVFAIGALIGAYSAGNDSSFCRLILGDEYVNRTLENINSGDPMAVYKSATESQMFLGITMNNLKVAIYAYACGLIFSVGSCWILFQNGIMLGAFQYFFFERGLFLESFRTIWIHGTIEISAIIIAGAAGIILGNSFMFPGTYSRSASFARGAKKGIKIAVALVPFIVTAGFLESYVTRHNEMPLALSFKIIGFAAALIVWYFFNYPIEMKRHNSQQSNLQ